MVEVRLLILTLRRQKLISLLAMVGLGLVSSDMFLIEGQPLGTMLHYNALRYFGMAFFFVFFLAVHIPRKPVTIHTYMARYYPFIALTIFITLNGLTFEHRQGLEIYIAILFTLATVCYYSSTLAFIFCVYASMLLSFYSFLIIDDINVAKSIAIHSLVVAGASYMASYFLRSSKEKEFSKIEENEQMKRELTRVKQQLKRLDAHDPITEVPKKQFFDLQLDKSLSSCKIVSLLLIDVDFFAKFNEHFGEEEGDKALKQIAYTLSSNLSRDSDFLSRYVDDNFAVVLENTNLVGAVTAAGRLRKSVEDLMLPHHPEYSQLTVSVGVSVVGKGSNDGVTEAVRNATACLEEAKRKGGNVVVPSAKEIK